MFHIPAQSAEVDHAEPAAKQVVVNVSPLRFRTKFLDLGKVVNDRADEAGDVLWFIFLAGPPRKQVWIEHEQLIWGVSIV